MNTYIINLETAVERKKYIEQQIDKLTGLSAEFVKAVDGRKLTDKDLDILFNKDLFYRRYGRYPRSGEIGCTLSHQKCFKMMVDKNIQYALILEDDILIKNNERINGCLQELAEIVEKNDKPVIILLSSWFWYWRKRKYNNLFSLVDITDAFSTYAYMINNQAAKLLLERRPCITADDWRYIRKKGVNVWAVYPHLVDHNGELESSIRMQTDKSPYWWRICHLNILFRQKILKLFGRFEAP